MTTVNVHERDSKFILLTDRGLPVGNRMWRGAIKGVKNPPEETEFTRKFEADMAALDWNFYLMKSQEQRKKK